MYSRLKISIWLAAYSTFSSEIGEEVAFCKKLIRFFFLYMYTSTDIHLIPF